MSKRTDRDLIEDILICISKIRQYSQGVSYKGFDDDFKTQDAIIRNLEIIGEASKQISPELKDKYPFVLWKMIAGTRDRLIHGYFGVNIDIVWDIVTMDIPVLEREFKKIKREYCS